MTKKTMIANRLTLLLALMVGACAAEVGSVEESLSRGGEGFWTGTVLATGSTEELWTVGSQSTLDLFGPQADGIYRGTWYQGTTYVPIRAAIDEEGRFRLRGDGVSGRCREREVGTLTCLVTTPGGYYQWTEGTEFTPELGVGVPTNPPGSPTRCPWTHQHPCGDECCVLGKQGCSPQDGCYDIPSVGGGTTDPVEVEGAG